MSISELELWKCCAPHFVSLSQYIMEVKNILNNTRISRRNFPTYDCMLGRCWTIELKLLSAIIWKHRGERTHVNYNYFQVRQAICVQAQWRSWFDVISQWSSDQSTGWHRRASYRTFFKALLQLLGCPSKPGYYTASNRSVGQLWARRSIDFWFSRSLPMKIVLPNTFQLWDRSFFCVFV